jgi:glycosyltransferase involved in cell wall biosynthesis
MGRLMMRPYISIIVPVFNVEEYLSRCLETLINQTLREIEIIIIDDGSTDHSVEIIMHYAQNDLRIKVIKQENQGLSGARNSGLTIASGEYIGFVDSDDWVEKNMFETMYLVAKKDNSDICVCDYNIVYEDKVITNYLKLSDGYLQIEEDNLEKYWIENRCSVVVWNKIYKKSIIDEFSVFFESKLEIFSEDTLFNLYYILHTKVVSSIAGSYYNYFQRSNSIMNSTKPDFLKKELNLVEKFRNYSADYNNKKAIETILSKLLCERIVINALQRLDENNGIQDIYNDLIYLSKDEYFYPSMIVVMKDNRLWLPIRGLALLCYYRLFSLSSYYLYCYHKFTKIKKYIISKIKLYQKQS